MKAQRISSAPAVGFPYCSLRITMIILATFTVSIITYAQEKQMIQVKTFDEKLRTLRNVDLSLNNGDFISTGNKGAAYVELSAGDLPIKSIKIKDEKLEAASWNFSKGVIEIIVRQRSYTLVRITLRQANGRPVASTPVFYKGSKPVTITTNQAGEFELPLPLQDKLTSADQFQVQDMKTLRITLTDKENVLVVERLKDATVKNTLRQQFIDFDLSRLDSIQSLTVFYAVFKNIPMSNLSPEARARVDAKFRELVSQMQDSVSRRRSDFMAGISDSSLVAEDIHNLLSHATRENQALDINRTAFEEKINVITRKVTKGVTNMDEKARKSLLSDLDLLEAMLIENESKFYKNQNDYRDIISTLKDKYFDVRSLEEKLTFTEQRRLEEQRVFQQQLLTTIGILIVFGVLIVLLISFSGRLKQQREALRAANEEIKTMNDNLEAIVVKRTLSLEESNRELDTFLYRASHDLRSPISSILGLCNIGESISTRELVDRVRAVVTKMDRMLKKLIETSEIHQESKKLANFCLSTAIADVQKTLSPQIQKSNVQLCVECKDEIQLHSSATVVKTILANLIENAVFFSQLRNDEHARVEVKAAVVENAVKISIYDNGAGIDEQVRQNVFNMFFIGHEKSHGNGLGLYVVKKAARALEGTVEVMSEAGKYSKFTLSLPLK